jgi:hypothetical protein
VNRKGETTAFRRSLRTTSAIAVEGQDAPARWK